MVAELIQQHGMGTLLFDLLTEQEDRIYENRFNIDLLVSRLIEATEWLMNNKDTQKYPVAYFEKKIKAVVSRGGRPDLALKALPMVTAPTLLIVGQLDVPVIQMNKQAFDQLHCIKEMKIIPGATHLFEEPGKLIEVAEMAISWYKEYFV
jgi:pimeloyl-ACP methyl ester carboxylesterase